MVCALIDELQSLGLMSRLWNVSLRSPKQMFWWGSGRGVGHVCISYSLTLREIQIIKEMSLSIRKIIKRVNLSRYVLSLWCPLAAPIWWHKVISGRSKVICGYLSQSSIVQYWKEKKDKIWQTVLFNFLGYKLFFPKNIIGKYRKPNCSWFLLFIWDIAINLKQNKNIPWNSSRK